MTEADSSESAGSEKLVDDYEFLDFNNGGLFVQVRFRTFIKDPNSKNVHIFVTPNPLVRQIFDNIFSITVFISTRWSNECFKLTNNDSFL